MSRGRPPSSHSTRSSLKFRQNTTSRLPTTFRAETFQRLADEVDRRRYEKEWQEGRSTAQVLQEVLDFIRLRGPSADLERIRDALVAMLRKEKAEAAQASTVDLRSPNHVDGPDGDEVGGDVREDESEVFTAPEHDEIFKAASIYLASWADVPEGFRSLGSGFYRRGHSIWELRAAEDDDGGYVLTRKHEERAVDLRATLRAAKVASAGPDNNGCRMCEVLVGRRVACVKEGQVIPVLILNVDDGMADVRDDDGGMMQMPVNMLMDDEDDLDGCPCTSGMMGSCPSVCSGSCGCDGDAENAKDDVDALSDMLGTPGLPQPESLMGVIPNEPMTLDDAAFETTRGPLCGTPDCTCSCSGCAGPEGMTPQVEPTSKSDVGGPVVFVMARCACMGRRADLDPYKSMLNKTIVVPNQPFTGIFMGGWSFNPEDRLVYSVEGMHAPDPKKDEGYGVPNPIHPKTGGSAYRLWRIRLISHDGLERAENPSMVFVTPEEFGSYFDEIRLASDPSKVDENAGRSPEDDFDAPYMPAPTMPTQQVTPGREETQQSRGLPMMPDVVEPDLSEAQTAVSGTPSQFVTTNTGGTVSGSPAQRLPKKR